MYFSLYVGVFCFLFFVFFIIIIIIFYVNLQKVKDMDMKMKTRKESLQKTNIAQNSLLCRPKCRGAFSGSKMNLIVPYYTPLDLLSVFDRQF